MPGEDPPEDPPADADGEPERLTVTVLLTVYNDDRIERVVDAVLAGTRVPDELLIADGGSTDGTWELAQELEERHGDPVRAVEAPGNIPETRNQAIEVATGDVVAFVDADELPPEGWLEALVAPIEAGDADFTGGPTPGLPDTLRTAAARYYDAHMQHHYETTAPDHPHALPMGNSAWRRACFDEVGELSVEGLHRRAPGEDHDFAVRCLDAGFEGRYVPDAWCYHDYHHITLPSLLEKQFHYALGGFHVYRRHGTTYRSSPLNLLPYALPPGLAGLAVLALPLAPAYAVPLALAAAGTLALLFLVEEARGLALADHHPGMVHRWIEPLRRYAVLLAAAVGLWQAVTGQAPAPREA